MEKREISKLRSALEDFDDDQDELSDGERNEQNNLSLRLRRAE
jgi:hypothetical protein